jgi:hypothetical protein
MATSAVYPNVYVIQSCSLWKTPLCTYNIGGKPTFWIQFWVQNKNLRRVT